LPASLPESRDAGMQFRFSQMASFEAIFFSVVMPVAVAIIGVEFHFIIHH
jgi:hypothetical protein